MNLSSALQLSNQQVLVQAVGRLLYQLSFGLMNFYIPILFVNRMGFSATSVGFALGLVSITEVAGHLIGGTLADSARFGRKTVLTLAGGCGLLVSILLMLADSLWLLMVANLVLGVSLGFYWTASGAAVMDATASEERPQAFAVLGLMEYIGIGIGILGGSALLGLVQERPQFLFGGCTLAFLGGWAMDQAPLVAHRFWLGVAISTGLCITLLWVFEMLHAGVQVQTSES
jgi:MFS family permease